jgi:ribosomal protein S18 acetylase RimI-like enzyme
VGEALAVGRDLAAPAGVNPPDLPTLPVPLDLADEPIARSVLALQRESYAVEAALIGSDGIPQLTETLEELRGAGLDWLGTFDETGLTGAVSWMILDDGTVDIHRLVVAPRAFRRGIASALLDELDARFANRPTLVSTGRGNGPALELYRRRGFRVVREREAIPGLWVTELSRGGPAGQA